jgi:hypothetical protein
MNGMVTLVGLHNNRIFLALAVGRFQRYDPHFFSIIVIEMSNNPYYTGLQTFTIPLDIQSIVRGDITTPKHFTLGKSFSFKQSLANSANVIPDLMRPRPENMVLASNFQPWYTPPTQVQFPLHKAAKRRSQDDELR